jgi:gluconolactonase
MRKLTEWGGDGMSMDELGNFYISNGQGVMAFDRNGNNILIIPFGNAATNNTFAGRNDKLLFSTDSVGRVTGIKMNVKGVPGL